MKDEQIDDLKKFIDNRVSRSESNVREDLKQFIDGKVSQATSDLATKDDIGRLDSKIDRKIDELRDEMRDGFAGVGDAIEEVLNQNSKLEKRVTRLEQKPA